MKRFSSTESALREAHRFADPMTGSILDTPPSFDPQMLPHVDWPVSPKVQRAVGIAVSEAIDTSLSLRDAFDRVRSTLESYGIVLSNDDIESWITKRRSGSR